MMRFACLAALSLAACSGGAESGDSLVGVYRGSTRDALCIAREGEALKAGLVTYGDRDMNCSLAGRAEVRGEVLILMPRGDSECSVEIRVEDGAATLGARSQSCAYYCGPGANYAGRTLSRASEDSPEATDFAGDKLC